MIVKQAGKVVGGDNWLVAMAVGGRDSGAFPVNFKQYCLFAKHLQKSKESGFFTHCSIFLSEKSQNTLY